MIILAAYFFNEFIALQFKSLFLGRNSLTTKNQRKHKHNDYQEKLKYLAFIFVDFVSASCLCVEYFFASLPHDEFVKIKSERKMI